MGLTVQKLMNYKSQCRKIVVLTAWDFAIAQILDEAGVDVILVGDSLGMIALGYNNTIPVTLEQMIHHAGAVCRGVKQALVVCDLPFLTYQESTSQAIASAGKILKETAVQAVKVEGGHPAMIETVAKMTAVGIPVMGHVGLTPQSVHRMGYKQQGKTEAEADRILQEAIALTQAGVFALVLEHIPSELAATITQKVSVPTIGIGAGVDCDGQVLVSADILGLSTNPPPFAKVYTNLRASITDAVHQYAEDVRGKS